MNAPSLKESLERWTLPPKLPPTFDPQRTRKATSEAAKTLGDVKPRKPPLNDLKILHRRVVDSWRRGPLSLADRAPRPAATAVGPVLPATAQTQPLAGRGTPHCGGIRPLAARRSPLSLRAGAAARVPAHLPDRPANLRRSAPAAAEGRRRRFFAASVAAEMETKVSGLLASRRGWRSIVRRKPGLGPRCR